MSGTRMTVRAHIAKWERETGNRILDHDGFQDLIPEDFIDEDDFARRIARCTISGPGHPVTKKSQETIELTGEILGIEDIPRLVAQINNQVLEIERLRQELRELQGVVEERNRLSARVTEIEANHRSLVDRYQALDKLNERHKLELQKLVEDAESCVEHHDPRLKAIDEVIGISEYDSSVSPGSLIQIIRSIVRC